MKTEFNTTLQIMLSAFGAGTPDGILGNKTTNAIKAFQRLVMHVEPTGEPTEATLRALSAIECKPLLQGIACQCGQCSGFGNALHENVYREHKPKVEAYYQYEYPAISSLTTWAAYGIVAMYPEYDWLLASGYRCHANNSQHGRTSTNHMGKALDIQPRIESRQKRANVCDKIRRELFDANLLNVGWDRNNTMSLEPSSIAPTWIHVDCRTFSRKWILATMPS